MNNLRVKVDQISLGKHITRKECLRAETKGKLNYLLELILRKFEIIQKEELFVGNNILIVNSNRKIIPLAI